MALKNGSYLPVHFSDDLKKLLENFSNKIGMPQSKICEQILSLELPRYVESYLNKMEVVNETSTNEKSS